MTKKLIQTTIVIAFLCLNALPTHAQTYFFNTANTIGTWSGDTTMPGYGSVEITKSDVTDWVSFTIIANPEYFITDPQESSGLTWDKFFFNFNPDKTLDIATIVVDPDDSGKWNAIFDQNASSFGIYDYGEKGTALPKMVNPLNITIQDTTLDILDFVYPNMDGYLFEGHLRRFADGIENFTGENEGSIQLAVAPVPEPATLFLLGSGLGGLLLYRKRRAE